MDEIKKEKEDGLDWEYLAEGLKEKEALKGEYYTPHAGLFGQMFSVFAKSVIDVVGKEKGEAIIMRAVEVFGEERGRRIAEKVRALDKPLSFKNFMAYTDLDSSMILEYAPKIEDGDLHLEINRCDFEQGASEWGLREYFKYYCMYVDVAILKGYNPELNLEIPKKLSDGDDICFFKYNIKGK